ncbi:MAG: hypothetical protein Q8N47_00680 [Bryobacterales bacterium]|nr:hypothetical protein [Bryobacterales bacterium]
MKDRLKRLLAKASEMMCKLWQRLRLVLFGDSKAGPPGDPVTMSEIHYFPRYSQPENVVTNNTLLLLLRLHQHNRFKFQKFMERLCKEEDIQLAVSWLQFSQQKGTGKSIVDGFIAQDSLKIAVETKLDDSFGLDQLKSHLAVFKTEQHKLLILLSRSPGSMFSELLKSIRSHATPLGIQVVYTSFEDIIREARICLSKHDEEMLALVDDFESFCSSMGVLPRDKCTMFVPPCGQSFLENEEFSLYYCPATWSRRSAAYLGIYAAKTVRSIGRRSKVVECSVDLTANDVAVLDSVTELTVEEKGRILGATRKAETRNWDLCTGYKFYLCDEMVPTDFCKMSPGGIMGHRYFDLEQCVGAKIPATVGELASLLRQRTWK